ncbi:MAG: NADH-quinone oxidoreductase subunit [Clostridia bacterium]|nr:NADH-quinone oxidoreductase subunit [Clostridia bacterium]
MAYCITNACIACGDCTVTCPRKAIVEEGCIHHGSEPDKTLSGAVPQRVAGSPAGPAAFYRITASCDACGRCQDVCPAGAIVWYD